MAGSDTGFVAAEFREAIRFAMLMGSPNAIQEKATFRWNKAHTFDPQDPARRPYHWNEAVVTDTTPPDVVLDHVAIEYHPSRTNAGTDVGSFVPLKADMTLLDQDFALVAGADQVIVGGNTWLVVAITMQALFSVDVHTLYCERQ